MSNPAADRSLSVDNQIVPQSLRCLTDPSRELPRLAKNRSAMAAIEAAVVEVPTRHQLLLGDARLAALPAESVHVVVTSPPYWVLKEYRRKKATEAACCGRIPLLSAHPSVRRGRHDLRV